MSKQDELQYEQQEKRIQAQSDAFITLLTKRGILGDSQIDDAQKRAARQEKTKNCYHNTLMLLQHYRTLVWMLECFPETVAAELDRPFEGVDKLIEDVDVEVALGNKKIESRMQGMRSGVECRPYMLPILQNRTITKRIPDAPCFYLAKELKKLGEAEMNKTMFTRMVGTAYLGQRPYAVYNTRSAVMKWSGKGEFKTLHSVIEISRLNAGTDAMPAAILLGQSESVALKTLLESDTTKRPEFRFDAIYRNLYFIPMDEHGIRQLRLMTVPDWKERLLELLFDPEVRTYDRGLFEYDAKIGDAYVFSHLDGDLARLVRFKEAVQNQRGNYEVLCYPYQMTFIREYLGNHVTIKTIGLDAVEAELDPERRDLFER